MIKSIKYFFIISFMFGSFSFAQNIEQENFKLTGNLSTDSKILLNNYEDLVPLFSYYEMPDRKSPVLAGIMSAILPGSGELYVGEYLKAAIFFAVEAALITTAVIYDNKGDDKTTEFQNFADEHWSVVKYAEYLNSQGAEIYINPDESLPPWERVNWTELNAAKQAHMTYHSTVNSSITN